MQVNRRILITFIALAIAIPLHWYLNAPSGAIPAPWHMPRWRWELMSLFTGLFMVVPGFAVGFVAGRSGLLLGAIVGYLGFSLGTPHAVISAAGGGAGQLLRSNTSLERNR